MKIPYKFNPLGISKSEGGNEMPTSGLVFYMPLSGSDVTAELIENRTMTVNGSVTSANFGNINCAYFGDEAGNFIYNNTERGNLPEGDHSISLSIWVSQQHIWNDQTFFFYGQQDYSSDLWIFYNWSQIVMGSWGADLNTGYGPPVVPWQHYVATYDKDEHKYYAYINGELAASSEVYNVNLTFGWIGIGCRDNWWDSIFTGCYMAGARIYDRALTSGEVATLYTEFTPLYDIVAPDPQVIKFYPYGWTYGINAETLFPITNYEIVSGSLPSNISFNTSTGEFSGTALTDARHNYTVYVKMTGNNLKDKTIVVLISTFPETYLTADSPQYFSFTTEGFEQSEVQVNKYYEDISFSLESELPPGINIYSYGGGIIVESDGTQTESITSGVDINLFTEYHPENVPVTLNISVQLNQITADDQTIRFFTAEGVQTYAVKYKSEKTITPTYDINGTLPSGVTFNQYTGTFTYDGTGPATTGTVDVGIYSNYSTPASAEITLKIIEGEMTAPDDYVFYFPMNELNDGSPPTTLPTGQGLLSNTAGRNYITSAFYQNVQCLYNSHERDTHLNWCYYANGVPSSNQERTISLWFNCDLPGAGQVPFLYGYQGYGDPDYGGWVRIRTDNVVDLAYYDYDYRNDGAVTEPNKWYNVVITVEDAHDEWNPEVVNIKYYLNGINYGLWQTEIHTTDKFLYLWGDDWDNGYKGYMTDLRIYNRVLENNEISALFKEHKPVIFNDQSFVFITSNGVETRTLDISATDTSQITYALSGTLPSGVTFDTTSGTFTSDGTQQGNVGGNVIVSAIIQNNLIGSANIELNVYMPNNNPIITEGLTLYMPLSSSLNSDVGIPLSTLT